MKKIISLFSMGIIPLMFYGQFHLKGKVVDEENIPLSGANVIIENTFIGTFTNVQGEFFIKNLKSGTYSLKVSFIGYETKIQNVEINENTEPIIIQLKKSPFIANEIVVQATRNPDLFLGSSTNIEKEDFKKNILIQDIPYLISKTPSVVASSDAGTGIGYTHIFIRGTNTRRINVTINDIPLNDSESHGVWWVDLPDLVSSVDNIQIQRGVGSSNNGAGAFGASINLNTISLNKEPTAEIQSVYGSYNTSKFMINASTGLINNHFNVDIRLSKMYSDGFIDRAFSDLRSYYFATGYHSAKTMIKFINFAGHEKTYQAWYGVPKDSLKTNPTYNPYTYENQTDNYWQSHYHLHFTHEIKNNIHLHSALHYTYGKGYYESYRNNKRFSKYGMPNVIIGNDTIKRTDFIDQKWLDNDFYGLLSSLKWNHKNFQTTIGLSANRYEGRHFGDVIWGQILPYNIPKYSWYFNKGDKIDATIFIKENYFVSKNLMLFADFQYRKIFYSINGKDEDFRDITQKHEYDFFNPKGGVQYTIDNRQSVFASVAVAQREPSRSDFTDADSAKIPKSEKLIDYELSYRYKAKNLFLGINLYYMDYYNQLVMTGEINNVGSPINTNVARSFRRGIELECGTHIHKSVKFNSSLTLSQNKIKSFTAYFDDWDNGGQISKYYTNTDISFSPSVIGNGILQYNISKKIEIHTIYQYVGSQYLSNIQMEEVKIPSYSHLQVVLNYTLNPKWCREIQFQISGKNLLTDIFVSNGWAYSYYYNGSLLHEIAYYPQAKNMIFGSIKVKF